MPLCCFFARRSTKERERRKLVGGMCNSRLAKLLSRELSFVVENLYGLRQCQHHSRASIRDTSGARRQQLFSAAAAEESTTACNCVSTTLEHRGCFMASARASIQPWKTRPRLCLTRETGRRAVRLRGLPRGRVLCRVDDKLSYKLSTGRMKMHYAGRCAAMVADIKLRSESTSYGERRGIE